METVIAARHAMATRFEVVLHGESQVALRAAADEAFLEIERLHAQLSLYSPSSEISHINARAAREAVQVEPRLFQLLRLARRIHDETGGLFDITIAPLLRCWGFMGGTGAMASPEQVTEARARVGMRHVLLDERRHTVRFAREGMMLDLGSIGKGYALEQAAELLIEAGVSSALIHGGTSTACAIGTPPEAESWKVALEYPIAGECQTSSGASSDLRPGDTLAPAPPHSEGPDPASALPRRPAAVVSLKNEALSVSGAHGKFFKERGRTYGHVIDPRTGEPARGALMAAVVLPSATETDAFSTALLISGIAGHDRMAGLRPAMRTFVLESDDAGRQTLAATGIEPLAPGSDLSEKAGISLR